MIRNASETALDRRLKFTNLDKVLYPQIGFTKGQVIEYYIEMAQTIMPHVSNRAVTLKRYPNGVNEKYFYQKNCPAHRPGWLKTGKVAGERRKSIEFCIVDDVAALAWMANLASIELHTYLSRIDKFDQPTMMVFDLDPGPGMELINCMEVAAELRDVLDHFSIECFPKTSGGKGLHMAIPLNTPCDFKETKAFSKAIADVVARQDPERITTNMRKELRRGKVFVDWSQNDRHKTTVCAYSLRARATPMVSMPLSWGEIDEALAISDASHLMFDADSAIKRVQEVGDLFEPVAELEQTLPEQTELKIALRD